MLFAENEVKKEFRILYTGVTTCLRSKDISIDLSRSNHLMLFRRKGKNHSSLSGIELPSRRRASGVHLSSLFYMYTVADNEVSAFTGSPPWDGRPVSRIIRFSS